MARSRMLVGAIGLCVLTLVTATGAQAALVAYFPFDSVGGTTPELVAGDDATVVGNPALTAGVFGNALDFDGDDYLTHSETVNRAEFTIAHWLRPQDIPSRLGAVGYYESNGTGANYNGFNAPSPAFELHSGMATPAASNDTANYPHLPGTGGPRWWFLLQDGTAGTPNQANNQQINMIGGLAVEDTWTHVAITKTAAGLVTLYENGIAVHTVDTAALNITQNGIATSTRHIGVHGGPGAVNPDRFWTGLMDDLAIYDHALSQEEIGRIMTNGVPEPSSLLLLFVGGIGVFAYRRLRAG